MSNIETIRLLDLIPDSLRCDGQVQAAAQALEEQLHAVSKQFEQTILIARIDVLAEETLDLLAWQYHVDYYEIDLAIDKKRLLIRNSIIGHRHKGTPFGVELAMKVMLAEAYVKEWFEYGGRPFFFQIESSDLLASTEAFDKLIKIVFEAKNTRSWLDVIRLYRERMMKLYLGMIEHSMKTMTVYHEPVERIETTHNVYAGHIQRTGKLITIYPEAI